MRSCHYGDPITPAEFADGIEAMIEDAKARGGGRYSCCSRGQCALHLAEADRGHVDTVHTGSSIALFPETERQALTASAAKAQYLLGLRVLGLDPDFAA